MSIDHVKKVYIFWGPGFICRPLPDALNFDSHLIHETSDFDLLLLLCKKDAAKLQDPRHRTVRLPQEVEQRVQSVGTVDGPGALGQVLDVLKINILKCR